MGAQQQQQMAALDAEEGRATSNTPPEPLPVKRVSPGSSEEQPLFDSEGKFGKRYKVCAAVLLLGGDCTRPLPCGQCLEGHAFLLCMRRSVANPPQAVGMIGVGWTAETVWMACLAGAQGGHGRLPVPQGTRQQHPWQWQEEVSALTALSAFVPTTALLHHRAAALQHICTTSGFDSACESPVKWGNMGENDSHTLSVRTRSLAHARRNYGVLDWMQVFLPMVGWLRTYNVKQCLLVRLTWLAAR